MTQPRSENVEGSTPEGEDVRPMLRELRARHRLTQAELARELGATVLSVNRWENGQARPSARMLRRLEEFDRERRAAAASPRPVGNTGSLRSPRSSFIGREAEVVAVSGLLRTSPLLTLTGAGGSGKTRLALYVAAAIATEYADGAWFVDLATITAASLVPAVVAGVLGVREQAGVPLIESVAVTLQNKQALLLLDNCEHVIAAAAELADGLLRACPRLQILATSREELRIECETTFRVPPLPLPAVPEANEVTAVDQVASFPAIALFVDRTRALEPSFRLDAGNVAAVVSICRRLDGIPLAIELAAARVPVLGVSELSGRLDDRFRVLSSGFRTAPPRQQTLRAAVQWSYELLNASERAFFKRLSVFAGSFTLAAAEAMAGSLPLESGVLAPSVIDLLAQLGAKSLIEREDRLGSTRYRLLETLRSYADERLQESGEHSAARGLHAAYYRDLVEQVEGALQSADQATWLDELEYDLPNLRAALTWSLATPDPDGPEIGLRLASAAARLWLLRGYPTEGRTWLERGLTRLDGRPGVRAKALLVAGKLALHQTDLEPARAQLEAAVALLREFDDPALLAQALLNLGHVLNRSDTAAGFARYEEALAVARTAGTRAELAESLSALGTAAMYRGDPIAALPLLEESAAFDADLADPYRHGITLGYIGLCYLLLRDVSRSLRAYKESLALCHSIGEKQGTSLFILGFGGCLLELGEPRRAAVLFGVSEALREEAGMPLYPAIRPLLDAAVQQTRAAIGEQALAEAWAERRNRPLDDTMAEIQAQPLPPERPSAAAAPKAHSSPASSATPASFPGLSPREAEVLELLAAGFSNKQIGGRLALSARTVERHIANIYTKAGVHSRAEATAFALRQGSRRPS